MADLFVDYASICKKQMEDIKDLRAQLERKDKILTLRSAERYVFTAFTVKTMSDKVASSNAKLYLALMFLEEILNSGSGELDNDNVLAYLEIMRTKINMYFPEINKQKQMTSKDKQRILEVINSCLMELAAEANVIASEVGASEIPSDKSKHSAAKIKFEVEKIVKIGNGEFEI